VPYPISPIVHLIGNSPSPVLSDLNDPPVVIFPRIIQSQTVLAKVIPCQFLTMQIANRNYARAVFPL
jgi:hypothetical protein